MNAECLITDLPIDILLLIACDLLPYDLLNFRLVSKLLAKSGLLVAFAKHTIRITDMNQFIEIIRVNPYRHLIQKIVIDLGQSNDDYIGYEALFQYIPNVANLTFSGFFNQRVDQLHQSITHLNFGTYFNQPVDQLPQSITHLPIHRQYRHSLVNIPTQVVITRN